MPQENSWPTLRRLMDLSLGSEDLEQVCFDLNIDSSHLAGAAKPERIVSLLKLARKRDRLPDLLTVLGKMRPQVSWPTLSALPPPDAGYDPFLEELEGQLTPDDGAAQAANLLKLHDFDSTIALLKQVLQIFPEHPVCNLLIATARFRGHGAGKMTDGTAKACEAHLNIATMDVRTAKMGAYLLGVIKYDFYFANSLPVGKPPLHEIRAAYLRQDHDATYDWLEESVKASPQARRFLTDEE